jgi:hypothetical protein
MTKSSLEITPAPVTASRYGTEAEQRAYMADVLGMPRPSAGEIVAAVNAELEERNDAACKRMFGWFERIAGEAE